MQPGPMMSPLQAPQQPMRQEPLRHSSPQQQPVYHQQAPAPQKVVYEEAPMPAQHVRFEPAVQAQCGAVERSPQQLPLEPRQMMQEVVEIPKEIRAPAAPPCELGGFREFIVEETRPVHQVMDPRVS